MGLLKLPNAWGLDRHSAAASAWQPAQLSVSVIVAPVSAPSTLSITVCAGPRAGEGRGSSAAGRAVAGAATIRPGPRAAIVGCGPGAEHATAATSAISKA